MFLFKKSKIVDFPVKPPFSSWVLLILYFPWFSHYYPTIILLYFFSIIPYEIPLKPWCIVSYIFPIQIIPFEFPHSNEIIPLDHIFPFISVKKCPLPSLKPHVFSMNFPMNFRFSPMNFPHGHPATIRTFAGLGTAAQLNNFTRMDLATLDPQVPHAGRLPELATCRASFLVGKNVGRFPLKKKKHDV